MIQKNELFSRLGLFLSLLGILSSTVMTGCSSRPKWEPRSAQIAQAQAKGLPVTTMEEDRIAFFDDEEAHKKTLIDLIQKRSVGETRDANYHLGPGDEIEVSVFDVPELNVTVPVRQSGMVALPLVGALKAEGLTETQFASQLANALERFVRNPQVRIFVSNYGSQKVAMLGAVNKPGTYSLKKGVNSILELMGEAGGITGKAGNYIVFIPAELSGIGDASDASARARFSLTTSDTGEGQRGGIQIYLDQVMGTNGGVPLEIPVRGGDMVLIPESGKVTLEGEVKTPGSYDLAQQMTLLSALASAGGITYGALVQEVEIIRPLGINRKVHLVLDLTKLADGEEHDVRLRNGDIVRIPSHSGRRLTQDTFEGITQMINFGIGGSVNLAK